MKVIKKILKSIRRRIYKTEQEKIFDKWFSDQGDLTHRLNYDLSTSSVVFDLGGYKGEWAQQINDKYGCHIYIFEPSLKFFEILKNKFFNNDKIKVFNFGLADHTYTAELSLQDDASTLFSEGQGVTERIKLVSIKDFLQESKISHIDLLKINIEGAEYEVLNSLIQFNLHKSIHNIQVQFHDFVDNSKSRRAELQELLVKSHQLTYNYPFVWENWKLR